MFDLKVERARGNVPVTIFRLTGSFDTAASDQFEKTAREAMDEGDRNFLIDLSGVTFLSSVGIRSITTLYYQLHPASSGEEKEQVLEGIRTGGYNAPHLKLLKPSKEALRVLRTTGLDMVLDILDDETAAVNSF